jgi:hypothetical protein
MARVEAITVAELYSQLLSFENRIDLKNGGSNGSNGNTASYDTNNSSSYVANRGRGGGRNHGVGGRGSN